MDLWSDMSLMEVDWVMDKLDYVSTITAHEKKPFSLKEKNDPIKDKVLLVNIFIWF